MRVCLTVASRNEVVGSRGEAEILGAFDQNNPDSLCAGVVLNTHYSVRRTERPFTEQVLRRCAVYLFSRERNPKSNSESSGYVAPPSTSPLPTSKKHPAWEIA